MNKKAFAAGAALHTGAVNTVGTIGSTIANTATAVGSSVLGFVKGVIVGKPETTQQIVNKSVKRAKSRR